MGIRTSTGPAKATTGKEPKMNIITEKIAEANTNTMDRIMGGAGYGITDELREALLQEFTNCAEADENGDTENAALDFLDALQYAAEAVARDLG